MQTPVLLALLITVLPFAAWLVEFLHAALTRRIPAWADKLSTVAIFASLGLALYLFFSEGVCFGGGISEPYMASWTWFRLGSEGMASSFVLSFDVTVDNLTCVMFLVVTIVAALVHLYSRGYMHGEDRYPRFFFYLSLFSFSMLGLCTTSNLAMLFIFWELVGVCSYFLIGFYFFKKSAADAGKKAFVTNRIGDAGFMAGIFLIISVLSAYQAPAPGAQVEKLPDGRLEVIAGGEHHPVGPGTRFSVQEGPGGELQVRESWGGSNVLSFQRIWESIAYLQAPQEDGSEHDRGPWGGREGLLVLAGLLVFMGCVTKSAQFPLHVWLPDAMEGPTPVSALIHAATMVAAGVYMICRMFPLLAGQGYMVGDYASSPALWVIAGVGAATAIFAGTIALVQSDLKKGLAYSTCSQLGYMVMAVGVGSATAAMFHLFTHAFFKACLFLCAGSVIHAVHSQEMSDMGGLRKKMPVTYAAFLISCLAISGVPFFSGFLSKESVLGQGAAFGLYQGNWLAWMPFALCAVTALLTALYMFRLLFLTFWGTPADQKRYDHAHESPPSRAVPLMVLSALAIFSAGIAAPLVAEYTGGDWFPSAVNDEVLVKRPMQSLASSPLARELFATQQTLDPLAHEESPEWSEPVRHFWHALHQSHYWVFAFSLLAAFGGIALAYFFFVRRRGVDFVSQIKPLARYREILVNLYYVDWFYTFRVVPTVKDLTSLAWWSDKKLVDGLVHLFAWMGRALSWLSGRIDALGIDGMVRGAGWLAMKTGNGLRRLVTGKIEDYVQYTVVGMGVFLLILILAS